MENKIDTYSVNSINTLASGSTFVLGQGIPDEEMRLNAQLYYFTLAWQLKNNRSTGTFQTYINALDNQPDAFFGVNKFGSCTTVALTSVMQYYTRLGKAHMIPEDISNFNILHDYKVSFTVDYFKDYLEYILLGYSGKLSDINKNLLKSEFVHQELLYENFKDVSWEDSEKVSLAKSISECGDMYNNFADLYGLKNYSYSTNNGTFTLPEKLVAGNPCIVHLTGEYPYKPTNGLDHAVVAHGFYGTRPLWYTVTSIIADYGWHTGDYGAVEVNKEYIYSFGSFNIF